MLYWAELRATALPIAVRSTVDDRTACAAGIWIVSAVPANSATTRTCQYCTTPVVTRTARTTANTAFAMLPATSSRFRSSRSTSTPANAARNSVGKPAAAPASPREASESVSSRTSQPCAVCCMKEPTVRIVEAKRNRRKFREARAGNDSTIRPARPWYTTARPPAGAGARSADAVDDVGSGGVGGSGRRRLLAVDSNGPELGRFERREDRVRVANEHDRGLGRLDVVARGGLDVGVGDGLDR